MEKQDDMIRFSIDIEDIVEDKDVSYMDAVIIYCEKKGLEIEIAAKMCSDALKAKIRMEAQSLHYLPRSNTAKLPI